MRPRLAGGVAVARSCLQSFTPFQILIDDSSEKRLGGAIPSSGDAVQSSLAVGIEIQSNGHD